MSDPERQLVFGAPIRRGGFLVGVFVILAEMAVNASFYAIIADAPYGASGRPMMHAALFFFVAIVGLVVGVPRCISDAVSSMSGRNWRQVALALLGLVLNLAALPLAIVVFHTIARLNGFVLKD